MLRRFFQRRKRPTPRQELICLVCRKPGVHFYTNEHDGWPDFTCFTPGERDRFLREWDYYEEDE